MRPATASENPLKIEIQMNYNHITNATNEQLAEILTKYSELFKKLSMGQPCEFFESAVAMEEASKRLLNN